MKKIICIITSIVFIMNEGILPFSYTFAEEGKDSINIEEATVENEIVEDNNDDIENNSEYSENIKGNDDNEEDLKIEESEDVSEGNDENDDSSQDLEEGQNQNNTTDFNEEDNNNENESYKSENDEISDLTGDENNDNQDITNNEVTENSGNSNDENVPDNTDNEDLQDEQVSESENIQDANQNDNITDDSSSTSDDTQDKENLSSDESNPSISEEIDNNNDSTSTNIGGNISNSHSSSETFENLNEDPIFGSEYYNGVIIKVEADRYSFPEGTILEIYPIEEISALYEKFEEDDNLSENSELVAFDIKFLFKGDEVQPLNSNQVKISFDYNENWVLAEAERLKVFHIDDKDFDGNKLPENTIGEISEIKINKDESSEGEVVVNADRFSIYAIISTKEPSVTITYNRNFGDTPTKNEVTYIKGASIEYPDIPSRDDGLYMFDGWYTDPIKGEEWLGDTENEIEVFAHWLEFAEINIPVGDNIFVTIMDRNLGALDSDPTNPESYGKYYQWGNNFGFGRLGEDVKYITAGKISADGYGPGMYFYNSTFYKQPTAYNVEFKGYTSQTDIRYWDSSNNQKLWGGESPSNPDTDKQGPCPSGYHIPDIRERTKLVKLYGGEDFKTINGVSYDGENDEIFSYVYSLAGNKATEVVNKLNLPYAGRRLASSASITQQHIYGEYYASTPNYDGYKLMATELRINNNNKEYELPRSIPKASKVPTGIYPNYSVQNPAQANSIRCFKNTEGYNLVFDYNDGTNIKEITFRGRRWEGDITKKHIPADPTREGFSFKGWSDSKEGQEDIISSIIGKPLGENKTLFAIWEEDEVGTTLTIDFPKQFEFIYMAGEEKHLISTQPNSFYTETKKGTLSITDNTTDNMDWYLTIDINDIELDDNQKGEILLYSDSTNTYFANKNGKTVQLNESLEEIEGSDNRLAEKDSRSYQKHDFSIKIKIPAFAKAKQTSYQQENAITITIY